MQNRGMNEVMHFINIDSVPLKSEHKGWFCSENINDPDAIDLYEIVTDFYDHPEARGCAIVSIDTFHLRKTVKKSKIDGLYPACVLNLHTQSVIRRIKE